MFLFPPHGLIEQRFVIFNYWVEHLLQGIIIQDKEGLCMAKSELFAGLDDIIFAEKDPAVIESEIINIYENLSGRTLHRADPVRLFLESIILIIIQQRNLIDFSAKQNLLAYASGSYLDHLGALLGVVRNEGEDDEHFRERIMIAPESFSNAGSKRGYEYFARSAHNDIIACGVLTPPDTSPGFVEIYPLMTDGELPNDEVIASVYEACNGESVRPDTDFVSVKKPVRVNFDVDLRYWIDAKNSSSAFTIIQRVTQAVHDYVKWQKSDLGRDINPSELNYRVIGAGAKRCEIFEPRFTILRKNEVAYCNDENVIYAGLEES